MTLQLSYGPRNLDAPRSRREFRRYLLVIKYANGREEELSFSFRNEAETAAFFRKNAINIEAMSVVELTGTCVL